MNLDKTFVLPLVAVAAACCVLFLVLFYRNRNHSPLGSRMPTLSLFDGVLVLISLFCFLLIKGFSISATVSCFLELHLWGTLTACFLSRVWLLWFAFQLTAAQLDAIQNRIDPNLSWFVRQRWMIRRPFLFSCALSFQLFHLFLCLGILIFSAPNPQWVGGCGSGGAGDGVFIVLSTILIVFYVFTFAVSLFLVTSLSHADDGLWLGCTSSLVLYSVISGGLMFLANFIFSHTQLN